MSTTYGKIRLRSGKSLAVEAYGATRVVKLEEDASMLTYIGGAAGAYTRPREIAIESAAELDRLIAALEMAREHCWPGR